MADPDAAVEPTRLRQVMARWPTGVSVVTARHQGRDYGMTVNAFLSVALDPPIILVSLSTAADTTPVVRADGRFAVSLLAAGQSALSERFARAVEPEAKFAGAPVARTPGGLARLEGALATLEARVRTELTVADHVLFFGDVTYADLGADGLPLVFHRRDYLVPEGTERLRTLPPKD